MIAKQYALHIDEALDVEVRGKLTIIWVKIKAGKESDISNVIYGSCLLRRGSLITA